MTYLPPIWEITLAYWFSAPTASIRPCASAVTAAELAEHPVASTASTSAASTAGAERAGAERASAERAHSPARGGLAPLAR